MTTFKFDDAVITGVCVAVNIQAIKATHNDKYDTGIVSHFTGKYALKIVFKTHKNFQPFSQSTF